MRTDAAIIKGRMGSSRRAIVQVLSLAALSAGLFWLVWIYGNGLRDPRYLDGWVLAGGMIVQLLFHVAVKTKRLSPKSLMKWRKVHIFVGYLLIAAFVSHTDFSLPDTSFEWALWTGFVLVTLSGLFGIYLAWSLKTKRVIDDRLTLDQIPKRRSELAREIEAAVASTETEAETFSFLPAQPYETWIAALYKSHLRAFLQAPRNAWAHAIGSQRPLKQLTDEIDRLSGFVDSQNQAKLATIKSLVIEKDRLDFARVYLGLLRGWQFVHVPITYALIVVSVLHIVVVYAFSSGMW